MNYSKGMIFTLLVLWAGMAWGGETKQQSLPTYDEVFRAKTDVWGEAAMRQENGASYEFFKDLLPPLRYVNNDFKHYPIVFSAPRDKQKARFVSNGSGINLQGHGEWKSPGYPVSLRVGEREEKYGQDVSRLDGPHLLQGYLPVVQLKYREYGCVYGQEAFLSTEPQYSDLAAVFVKFTLPEGKAGEITAHIGAGKRLEFDGKTLCDKDDNVYLWVGGGDWRWDPNWKFMKADITSGDELYMVTYINAAQEKPQSTVTPQIYQQQLDKTIATWQNLLDKGMQVQTPEEVVNNAWRTMLIGTYSLVRDNIMCYSSDNMYQQLYVAEGSDAVRSLMIWGHLADAYEMMPPIIKSVRPGLMYHRAGMKLQMLNQYYWLTRDAEGVNRLREIWQPEVDRIINDREPDTGLFPRERYCGDVGTQVYNLRSNANAWRGLRDTAAMREEMGQKEEARRLAQSAAEFRKVIIDATQKSEFHNVSPPFIPIALFGEEHPYDVLTADKYGSYYNIVVPYTIGSGVFGVGAEREKWMIDYLQQHGGLCMGMIRSRSNSEYWVNKSNVVDLYTRRYALALLQNDDVERALVGFYGKLAQGCTRDTFIDGEATCLVPVDQYGRQISLPPNSSANGYFLWMLRYLLVQDWDMDDDGKPETLRLMYATPRRWLMDGKTIKVERAPTAFGEVSVVMQSKLKVGEIVAEVTAPPRPCPKMLLRARVPEGWKITTAGVEGTTLPVDASGGVDVTGRTGKFVISFKVSQE